MFGFFLNTIALRTHLSGDPSFLEVMRRGRDELLNALDNDGVPFERVVDALCADRTNNKHPFFQRLFAFQPPLAPLTPNWKFTQMDIDLGVTKFDLHLELDDRPEGIIGRFMFSADLFDRETILRMIETWRTIVHRRLADPSQPISKLVPPLTIRRSPSKEWAAPSVKEEAPAPQRTNGLVELIRRLFRPSEWLHCPLASSYASTYRMPQDACQMLAAALA